MQGAVSRCLQLWQVQRGVSLWVFSPALEELKVDLKQSDCDTINSKAIYARQTNSAMKARTAKEFNAYR